MKPEQIISKDSQLKDLLLQLTEMLIANGAAFNPRLQIVYDDNGLSLHTTGGEDFSSEYLSVPTELMPSIDDYQFSIENGKIRCIPIQETSDVKKILMELMVQIYNLTDKIGLQAISSPFYNLRGHYELLNELVRVRANSKTERYLSLIRQNEWDTLLVETFLNSRVFKLKDRENLFFYPVLIPVIDYCNHRHEAKSFKLNENRKRISIIADGNEKANQIYVRYNDFDYLDTFLTYGFVEENAPFLFSIPVTVTLESGMRLSFTGSVQKPKKKLPDWMKSLNSMPVLVKQEKDGFTFSSIAIPNQKNPNKFRKILNMILVMVEPKQSEAIREKDLVCIEEKIILENRFYYHSLQERMNPIITDTNVSKYMKKQLRYLCSFSLEHLKNHKDE